MGCVCKIGGVFIFGFGGKHFLFGIFFFSEEDLLCILKRNLDEVFCNMLLFLLFLSEFFQCIRVTGVMYFLIFYFMYDEMNLLLSLSPSVSTNEKI
jgi:hypothetical protein